MSGPSELQLVGFTNPRGRLPAFLVPIFGDGSQFWIQDSVGDGLLWRFVPCPLSRELLSPANRTYSQKIGKPLLYAFQISEEILEWGSKTTMQMWLQKSLHLLSAFPFLTLEVLNFIENTQAVPAAVKRATNELAVNGPTVGPQWLASIKTPAQLLFDESMNVLMANTILGTVSHFRKKGVGLNIRIIADTTDKLQLEPHKGGASVLVTRFVDSGSKKVYATIFIHKDASRVLARLCIAKEIYVLLLELEAYETHRRTEWIATPRGDKLEHDSDLFAWELCKRYDSLDRDVEFRTRTLRFPSHLFDNPPKPGENLFGIPPELAFDPEHPFHLPPKV